MKDNKMFVFPDPNKELYEKFAEMHKLAEARDMTAVLLPKGSMCCPFAPADDPKNIVAVLHCKHMKIDEEALNILANHVIEFLEACGPAEDTETPKKDLKNIPENILDDKKFMTDFEDRQKKDDK